MYLFKTDFIFDQCWVIRASHRMMCTNMYGVINV